MPMPDDLAVVTSLPGWKRPKEVIKAVVTEVATNPGARRIRMTTASTVPMRRLRWLWDQRIVLGGLTLLAGREGLGKSTVAVELAAQVTRGQLDGEYRGQRRSVIYVATEDDLSRTVVPRLAAAGADLDRVYFPDAVTTGAAAESGEAHDLTSPVVLPLDVQNLAEEIKARDAALVVLDAATSVIDSRLDGDRDRQMRQGLESIARGIAESTGAAVLGIVHFGKRESTDTGKLILGSIAWSQVARSVLAVAVDEAGELVITSAKSNLGPSGTSVSARIVPAQVITDDGPTDVGRVEWLGETDRDARELLGSADDERSALDEAIEWLRSYFTDPARGGADIASSVIKAARADGLAERTVQRARRRLGVRTQRTERGWLWSYEPEGATA